MKSLTLFASLLLLALVGCRSPTPIYHSTGVTIPAGLQSMDTVNLAAEVVRHPILVQRGWSVVERMDDRLRARLEVRTHSALVDFVARDNRLIPVLVSTENLEQADGKIHPSYNSWIQNLERDMRRALFDIADQSKND